MPKVNPGKGPYPGGSARVQVRDIDATPIPGFDGDPMFELRVTIAHEMQHCVYAEAVAAHGEGTVAAEEQIVEAAAQAIVRSEGTTDARVMARVAREFPARLRARIAASAGQRARGGNIMSMDDIPQPPSEIFKALSDPVRWSIIVQMASVDELACSTLEDTLPVAKPTISRHLKLLCDAGLIVRFKEGAWVFYRAADEGMSARFNAVLAELDGGSSSVHAADLTRLQKIRGEQ